MLLSTAASIWMFVGGSSGLLGGIIFTWGARKPNPGYIRMFIGALLGFVPFALGIWFSLKVHSAETPHLELWFDFLFGQLPSSAWILGLAITDALTGGYVIGHRSSWILVNGKRTH